jgi:hypothetical protein
MKNLSGKIKEQLFNLSNLIKNYFKIDYLYYFLVFLFIFILIYKLVYYILHVKNYSLFEITLFFLFSTVFFVFIKAIENKNFKNYIANIILSHGKIILLI